MKKVSIKEALGIPEEMCFYWCLEDNTGGWLTLDQYILITLIDKYFEFDEVNHIIT